MVTTIKRINVGSAIRIGAITGTMIAFVMGLIMFGLQTIFFAGVSAFETSSYTGASSDIAALGAVSIGMMCVMFVVYVVMGAIGGGISGLVWSAAYNTAAKWVGGVEVELEGEFGMPLKNKRGGSVIDSIYE
jgi:hypothetical protein